MSGTRVEESTLGVILGRRRGGVPTESTAARAVSQASAPGSSLGTGYLGIGAGVLCAIQAVYGLAVFATHLAEYPHILPAVGAWLLFVAAFAVVSIAVASRGDRLPPWMYAGYLVALAGVVALDFLAIAPLGDVGTFASASVTAGFGLLIVATLRPAWELVAGSLVLLAAFATLIVLTVDLEAARLPGQAVTVALAVFPPLFAVFVVQRFRRMVQLELDRVLVQSTVQAPRFAVGMLASEELAQLDLAAEELLESVASGRSQLPLGPKTASTAATLATELRLHLIEGRRETWLYHAITESEQLGKSVRLRDPGSLAGLLDPGQRDGLLGAVWLLVADTKKTAAQAEVVLGPVMPPTAPGPRSTVAVPIVITTTGVARGRVDPSIWAALQKVGRFADSTENASLRVDVQCIVPNPAER